MAAATAMEPREGVTCADGSEIYQMLSNIKIDFIAYTSRMNEHTIWDPITITIIIIFENNIFSKCVFNMHFNKITENMVFCFIECVEYHWVVYECGYMECNLVFIKIGNSPLE